MSQRPTALRDDRHRRHLALGVVLALLALAGYANATVKHRRAAAGNGPASAVGEVFISGQASSSAWYCPGPLPLDVGKDTAAIELDNVSGRTVRGELDLVTDRGENLVHQVRLRPHSSERTAFPTPDRPGWGAASALFNGRGVGVTEIEHGSAGPVAQPCTTSVSANASLAGGSTKAAANVALALYDPGATPAVANVSFTTGSGNIAPPAFQGLAIGAGQLIVENVGEYLPSQQPITTDVQSSGGRIVVGTMDSDVVLAERTLGFSNGIATSAREWYLPPEPSGSPATQSFLVVNTGSRAAEVAVRTAANGASLGAATALRQVSPGGTVQFNLARDQSPGALRWGQVSVGSGDGVIVERSLVIPKAIAVPAVLAAPPDKGGARARSPYQLPATVPAGESATEGTPELSRGWLLAGGESDASASEVISFANPSAHEVTVHLSVLGADPATVAALAKVASIGLAPDSVLPVDLSGLLGNVPALALVARADGLIECGADLYARGKGSVVGFNSSAAIPLA